MDMLSRSKVFEEHDEASVKAQNIGDRARASVRTTMFNVEIIGEVLVMSTIVVFAWFVWCQALPYIWPAGPVLLIAPGFWSFMAGSIILRVIWNILFLCPKIRQR